MRVAVCIAYIVFIFLYFLIGETKIWCTSYICVLTIGVAFTIHEQKYNHTAVERQFFDYVKYVAIADCLYTIACHINGRNFALYNNDVFAYLMAIGMCVMLVHFAVKKDNFK